jgi:hypothetical protein
MANGDPTQAKLPMSKSPLGRASPNSFWESRLAILIWMPISFIWAWKSSPWVSRSLLPAVVEIRTEIFLPPLA